MQDCCAVDGAHLNLLCTILASSTTLRGMYAIEPGSTRVSPGASASVVRALIRRSPPLC